MPLTGTVGEMPRSRHKNSRAPRPCGSSSPHRSSRPRTDAITILADALLDLLLADEERFECLASGGNDLKTCSQPAVLSPDEGAENPRRQ
jgi:hypothetical protein